MLVGLIQTSRAAEAPALAEAVLAVEVNGVTASDGEVVLLRGEEVLVPAALVRRLHLVPSGPPVRHRDQDFHGLPVPWRLDSARQVLVIDAPAEVFAGSVVAAPRRPVPSPPDDPGLFLDYDVVTEHGTDLHSEGALAQAGAFGPFGLATQSARLVRSPAETRTVRLDTAWTLDAPAEMERLRLGDGISAAGSWGRPFRFGGIRWGRAFDTAPGFVTTPTLSLAGQTALPASVEVYVNDALQRSVEVPAGPFTIEDVPAVTGDGRMRMVVRDLLGRERIVETPYYGGIGLLRPGLDDWSFEAGRVRRRWGLVSDDYGDTFAAMTWRHGFTDGFTGEARGEARGAKQAVGLGAAVATDPGTLTTALAASRSPGGPGVLGGLGWEYTGRRLGLGLSVERASPAFSQLGIDDPRTLRGRQQARASLGLGEAGTVSLSVTRLTYWHEGEDAAVTSLTHAVSLRGMATLIASGTLTQPEHERSDLTVGVTLVVPLGNAATASTGHSRSRLNGSRSHVQASRHPRTDEDWGARASRSTGETERAAAGLTVNTPAATVSADVARADAARSARFQAQGSLVFAGGGAFAGRALGEAFAVVETGHPGLGVSRDNRRVATTDSGGRALVVGLRPYEENRIAIDPSDLPAEVEVPGVRQMVVPWRGAGRVVRFPLPASRGAVLRLSLADGRPVPVGARARLAGAPVATPVGYDGTLLVTPAERPEALDLRWPGGGCRARVPAAREVAVLAVLPLECGAP